MDELPKMIIIKLTPITDVQAFTREKMVLMEDEGISQRPLGKDDDGRIFPRKALDQ